MKKYFTIKIVLLSLILGFIQFTPLSAQAGANDFFNALIARPDVLRGPFKIGTTTYTVPRAWSFRPDPNITDPTSPYWRDQLNPDNLTLPIGAKKGYAASKSPARWGQRSYAAYQSNAATCTTDGKTFWNTCDSNPERQDAMKVMFPPFVPTSTTALASAIDATTTSIPVTVPGGFGYNQAFRVCNEVMVSTRAHTTTETLISVSRGQFGTTAAPCGINSPIYKGTLDSPMHFDMPINTKPGTHNYLYTWDYYFASSFVGLANDYKAIYMYSGSPSFAGNSWLLPEYLMGGARAEYRPAGYNETDYIGVAAFRKTTGIPCFPTYCPNGLYSELPTGVNIDFAGPPVTVTGSFPQPSTPFGYKHNKWIRIFMEIEQRTDDWDYVTIWLTDEDPTTPVVKVWNRLPFALPDGKLAASDGTPDNIDRLDITWDTSANGVQRGPSCNLATYVIGDYNDPNCVHTLYFKNFVVLEDPTDIDTLVQNKPGASTVIMPPPPPPTTTTLVGDLNGDRVVNSVDWSIMNTHWFTSYTPADLNGDGLVNSIDWSLMNPNWLRTI